MRACSTQRKIGLISETQHRFIYGGSTATALLSYSRALPKSLDDRMSADSAYFDFSKAFDSVRHDYLIRKLLDIRIVENALKWIADYLQNRAQVIDLCIKKFQY